MLSQVPVWSMPTIIHQSLLNFFPTTSGELRGQIQCTHNNNNKTRFAECHGAIASEALVERPWHSASKAIPIEPPWTFIQCFTLICVENRTSRHINTYTVKPRLLVEFKPCVPPSTLANQTQIWVTKNTKVAFKIKALCQMSPKSDDSVVHPTTHISTKLYQPRISNYPVFQFFVQTDTQVTD